MGVPGATSPCFPLWCVKPSTAGPCPRATSAGCRLVLPIVPRPMVASVERHDGHTPCQVFFCLLSHPED